jgi:hypothetical protein
MSRALFVAADIPTFLMNKLQMSPVSIHAFYMVLPLVVAAGTALIQVRR